MIEWNRPVGRMSGDEADFAETAVAPVENDIQPHRLRRIVAPGDADRIGLHAAVHARPVGAQHPAPCRGPGTGARGKRRRPARPRPPPRSARRGGSACGESPPGNATARRALSGRFRLPRAPGRPICSARSRAMRRPSSRARASTSCSSTAVGRYAARGRSDSATVSAAQARKTARRFIVGAAPCPVPRFRPGRGREAQSDARRRRVSRSA